jgi:hypothetical protein
MKTQEAFSQENVNQGDILWVMPILSFNKRNLEIILRWLP